MKKLLMLGISAIVLLAVFVPAGVQADPDDSGATDQENACWGQASAVFGRMGEMGIHSSDQVEPRLGLYNLAVLLFGEDATLQDLGAFVAGALEPPLSIDACM